MTLLIGALTLGLIMSLLSTGVFISFRIFSVADITVDGSFTLGASVTAVLLVAGYNPLVASACGFAAGFAAGIVTGILQTRFQIDSLLSGILVMTALYSVNLHVMGKSNVPLLSAKSLSAWCEATGRRIFGSAFLDIGGWELNSRDAAMLLSVLVLVSAVSYALYWFFRTEIGTALRATGNNPQMAKAMGIDVGRARIFGLALSNALVGLSGALLAQYQAFADAQMGLGMIVYGLASVIIGESLTGTRSLGYAVIGAVMGSVIFRLLIAVALRWGLNPNDLKLLTAAFVLTALVLPALLGKLKGVRHA